MKLRIRLGSDTKRVELTNQATLEDIYQAIGQSFGLPSGSFAVTLNGQEALEGDADTPLSQVGIVSGDLLKIIVTSSDPHASATHTTNAATTSSSEATKSDLAEGTSQGKNSSEMPSQKNTNAHAPSQVNSITKAPSQGNSNTEVPGTEPEAMDIEDPSCAVCPVYEPMLCCDSTPSKIPGSLNLLLANSAVEDSHQALLVVLHVLMMETGFVPKAASRENEMPEGWRLPGGTFKLGYHHPRCGDCEAKLTCVTLGQVLMVHGIVPAKGTSLFQLQLKPKDYIHTDCQPQSYNSEVFGNLAPLSTQFKDHIAYPILATLRHNLGLPALQGILALPTELQLKILRLLEVVSVLRLSETCQDLSILANDQLLWRHLYLREFGRPSKDKKDIDWKKMFKEKYRQRQEMRQARRQMTFVVPSLMSGPHMPPFHHLPGVRGGDYDMDPFYRGPVYREDQNPLNQHPPPGFPQFRSPPLPRGPFSSGGPRFGTDQFNPTRRYRNGRFP